MKKKQPPVQTTMRLPAELRARIKAQADKEGRSATSLSVLILNDGLLVREKVVPKETTQIRARLERKRENTLAMLSSGGGDVPSVLD